ncbi:hypothetical protein MAA_08867 [Metarhizium robertsii ARSEF 23]|uniref:Uncharacterized protein n=1 Tax=Metarhizium robertsii (strain ARSEF 23 / ATCC MYA-3075) TaxID=655844 RepID=E9F9B8_METRA|nr:uncharacterized protein MAA_08867 [Metarhizium robertsii ARSEF 23]EFY95723.1 hypothetical protein MAA_08867 [Metarhizium robertsii ARSEF 23]
MAQPEPSLPGADRIRSLKDEDSIFQAFDAYPWTKDTMFLSGLSAILGPPDTPGSPSDMAVHARIFYYAQRIGVQIDFAKYKDWLSRHPGHTPPQVLPEEYRSPSASSPSEPPLPWQQAAPKADLYVDRKAAAENATGDQPSYPMGFAEMLKLLQEGKPIPGIKQIPNTVVRDPVSLEPIFAKSLVLAWQEAQTHPSSQSVKPVGSRAAPKKPWERDNPQMAPEVNLPKALDTEFPQLDTEAAEATSAADPVAS